MNKWYSSQGKDSDTCLSSKITLVRNIQGVPFPCRLVNEQRRALCKKLYACIQNSAYAGEFDLLELDKLSNAERLALAEKSLITPQFARQEGYGAVLLSHDKSVSIMLCEEEHISISVMTAGLDLPEAYKTADEIDNIFIRGMRIAFSDRLGFLTSNPMQLGTGMKASVMLHLCAIDERGMLSSLKNMVSKLGFSLKAVYGDGSFYELSNEIRLGITEKSAIENLNAITEQIIRQERALRDELISFDELQDKIFRAMGTLKMARQLSAKELFSLISLVRLGIAMNVFDNNDNVTYEQIGKMLYTLGTASIVSGCDGEITQQEANRLRAQYVREKLR